MTQTEARARILETLQDWATIGTVARKLGLTRSSVEREVSGLRAIGKLEARRGTFWRNGRVVEGFEYRVAVIDCGPSMAGVLNAEERSRHELAAIFECVHGVEMCEACTPLGRRCAHRCVECLPESVFQEAR